MHCWYFFEPTYSYSQSKVIVFNCFRQFYNPSIIPKQNLILGEKFFLESHTILSISRLLCLYLSFSLSLDTLGTWKSNNVITLPRRPASLPPKYARTILVACQSCRHHFLIRYQILKPHSQKSSEFPAFKEANWYNFAHVLSKITKSSFRADTTKLKKARLIA